MLISVFLHLLECWCYKKTFSTWHECLDESSLMDFFFCSKVSGKWRRSDQIMKERPKTPRADVTLEKPEERSEAARVHVQHLPATFVNGWRNSWEPFSSSTLVEKQQVIHHLNGAHGWNAAVSNHEERTCSSPLHQTRLGSRNNKKKS